MSEHTVGTRDQWLAARRELLDAEKEHFRAKDELAHRRQALPWVVVEQEYSFETDDGQKTLAELFDRRSQLLVYHFMFGPAYKVACPSCSAIADGFNGVAVHLAHHDVMLWAVSRAPIEKLQAFKKRMEWTFPWASSFRSDFNADFGVGFTPEQQRDGLEYNFQREPGWKPGDASDSGAAPFAAMSGTDVTTYLQERPGMSAFALDDGVVYHTYSAYSRGIDALWGMYQWLDRSPLGRNEEGLWWRHHDKYPAR